MAAKPKVELPKPHVPLYMGDKAYVYEGKMYFTPEEGGPALVHPDHVDIIMARMEEDDAKAGRENQLAPTDPLASASRDDLVKELIRLRANATTTSTTPEEPLDIVADLNNTSGAPAPTTPPVANPFDNK